MTGLKKIFGLRAVSPSAGLVVTCDCFWIRVVARVVPDRSLSVALTGDGRPAYNSVFMSAAGDHCQCRVRFLISFWYRGQKSASISAAAINTGRCAQGGKMGSGGQERFQFITSVLPDRLKEKIHLARARWSSLVDKPCRATRLRVVDIPQVYHSSPRQICNA